MYIAHTREDGEKQSVQAHLTGTATLAGRFAEAFGAAEWGRMIGQYHDIGKAAPGFQKRILGTGPKVDHSTAGAKAVLPCCGMAGAYCIAGHHGGLPDGGSKADLPGVGGTLYARLQKDVPCDLAEAGPAPGRVKGFPFSIGPGEGVKMALFIRMLASCLVDADRLDTEAFVTGGETKRGGYDPLTVLLTRLDRHMQQFANPDTPIAKKRAEILAACRAAAALPPGMFTLTVPTGGGKTLASLAFALAHAVAHGLRRVIYVIPYVSIIEQTADVFRKALGPENVVEHHASFSFEDEEERNVRQRLATENWDAPVIVTTNVQFFESLFAAKTSKLRKLHNIAESVVILDEAQMIPLPYLAPCTEAIAELAADYRVTPVLMSATQPALGPYFPSGTPIREMMPDPAALYRFFQRTTIQNLGTIAPEDLTERLAKYGQVLCIVNTRKLAQTMYQALPKEGSYHLSTLMHPEHRRAVLRDVRARLKAGEACRVVSTSLVEAGVDLDFPVVYRQEAGLDSVIQAAGRCNREGLQAAAESFVYVFRLAEEKAPAMMRQAVYVAGQVWQAHADVAAPEAIRTYFESVYKLRGEGLDAKEIRAMSAQGLKAMSIPFRRIEDAFQLLESGTVPVIIATEPGVAPWVEQLRAGQQDRDLLRKLGAYTVNIYPMHLEELYRAGAVEQFGEDNWLLRLGAYYDADMGLGLDVPFGLGFMA